ncbi:hypothetical protein [Ascidiaceihabitans sp.]|uniref:hypothetical protein n=1 Tax=Ascidiaceihabitans sp. TaxID=1872644 RepID=UPI003298D0FE
MPNLVPAANVDLMTSSGVPQMMQRIRPQWQAKSLIQRVNRLLEVDPSSACQRLFNAAIHDLREKIVIAGTDIAKEAAIQFKLPPINKDEDVEDYPTSKVIDLAYRMGLFTRPEWRRVCRSYEIRRDLEHEDDEYEAGIEDCVYIFSTCIEVILAADPVDLLKISDVKDLVEQASKAQPGEELLSDFERAPKPRQQEILKFLVGISLDKDKSDIIQQNSFTFLNSLRVLAANSVLVDLATSFQKRIGRSGLDERHARVATACGAMPYLKQSARKELFKAYLDRLKEVGTNWGAYEKHGDVIRRFSEIGGFAACPADPANGILEWMVLTYIGTPGGRTSYGNIRHVYYSNTASPLILDLFVKEADLIRDRLADFGQNKNIKSRVDNQHVARRFERLLDSVEE